eukprot:scaffold6966_cov112-Cylindrotheca_fusiformis.AAC.6
MEHGRGSLPAARNTTTTTNSSSKQQPSALSVFMKELKASKTVVELVNDNPRSRGGGHLVINTKYVTKDATEKAIQRWEAMDKQRGSGLRSTSSFNGGSRSSSSRKMSATSVKNAVGSASTATAAGNQPWASPLRRSNSSEYFRAPCKPVRRKSPKDLRISPHCATESDGMMDGGAPFKPQRRVSLDLDDATSCTSNIRSIFASTTGDDDDDDDTSSSPLKDDNNDTQDHRRNTNSSSSSNNSRVSLTRTTPNPIPSLSSRLDASAAPAFPRRKLSVDFSYEETEAIFEEKERTNP